MIERPSHAQAGLTLVELMVVVLLSSLLTMGLFYMMSSQQHTYRNQVATLSSQESLWGAMEYLQRQIRMAGYGIGACGDTIHTAAGVGGTWKMIDVQNGHNSFKAAMGLPAADGTDSFSIRFANETSSTTGPTLLRLKGALSVAASHSLFNGPAPPATIGIADRDLAVICQPGSGKWASLVQVTGAPHWVSGAEAWDISCNHGEGSYNPPGGHSHFPVGGYTEGAFLVRYGSADMPRRFALDNTVRPGLLVTWEGNSLAARQVIADGVEDMQISWACDANQNGVFDEGACTAETCQASDCSARSVDEWADNLPSVAPADAEPPCNGAPIGVVRITLISRTASPIVGNRTGYRPGAEDRCKGTAADDLAASGGIGTYGRSVLTVRVHPKNISLTIP